MGKVIMIAALTVALVRMADSYLYYGRNTDAAVSLVRETLRSFGL